jgi:lipoprotein-anchoring transpeptidase ErfK/SrfK
VSTGRNGYTPDGTYRIYYKKALVRYREGDGMPYWMEFKPKFGFHGLPFDKDGVAYGLDELGKPASAGCVRLETVHAGLLYHVTPSHSLVVIQQEPPSY